MKLPVNISNLFDWISERILQQKTKKLLEKLPKKILSINFNQEPQISSSSDIIPDTPVSAKEIPSSFKRSMKPKSLHHQTMENARKSKPSPKNTESAKKKPENENCEEKKEERENFVRLRLLKRERKNLEINDEFLSNNSKKPICYIQVAKSWVDGDHVKGATTEFTPSKSPSKSQFSLKHKIPIRTKSASGVLINPDTCLRHSQFTQNYNAKIKTSGNAVLVIEDEYLQLNMIRNLLNSNSILNHTALTLKIVVF
jgi:hypothetical protein